MTEDRPEFMPWLLWNFDRQSYRERELVVVDSSEPRAPWPARDDIRVVEAPRGTGVAEKRNLALASARGEFVAWFDDDDWSSPLRLEVLFKTLAAGSGYAGPSRAWFFDLPTRRFTRYDGRGRILFNGALFRSDVARGVEFDVRLKRASDTDWLRRLGVGYGPGSSVDRDLFFWVCHGRNLSNPRARVGASCAERELAQRMGSEEWGDTSAALGRLPSSLRGERPATRDAGRPRLGVRSSWAREPTQEPRKAPATPIAGRSSITVVIPVRDRAGARVSNVLRSLAWQELPADEVLIVSHGSRSSIDAELAEFCEAYRVRLLCVGTPEQPWCKPLALNTGIRASAAGSEFVLTLDADMILAPNFIRCVCAALLNDRDSIVLCQSADMPAMPDRVIELADLAALRKRARVRGRHGCGGIQAMRRDFLFAIRGYDEDLTWWGAEDVDLVQRAGSAGLRAVWVDPVTFMLHQWHPRRERALDDRSLQLEARRAWYSNHRMIEARRGLVQRNPKSWGQGDGGG